jgi:hypothetical protein
MADLLAIDSNNHFIFVECLTKSSIKRKAHLKKQLLSSNVPFCFVGELPIDFVNSLPEHAFAISNPRSIYTIKKNGRTPFYFKDWKLPSHILGNSRKKRKGHEIVLEMNKLRCPEDISSFLLFELSCIFPKSPYNVDNEKWNITMPREYSGFAPFKGFNKPYSVFKFEIESSKLSIHFGTSPLVLKVQGSDKSLNTILKLLKNLPIRLSQTKDL